MGLFSRSQKEKWYFNTRTHQVERGKHSLLSERMGPYDTPEEAARAFQIARERTERADEQDRQWEEDFHTCADSEEKKSSHTSAQHVSAQSLAWDDEDEW